MAHSVSVVSGGRLVIINQIIPTYPRPDAFDTGSDKICPDKIRAALNIDSAQLGIDPQFSQVRSRFDVHVFDRLPSTSTHLWKMIDAGEAESGAVAIAQQQTAGRGQRGRVWCSNPGGLYLSLALEPDWPVCHSAQLTCMSAWGIATALNNLGIPIKIKWPNDLYFEGKKLGGILTETRVVGSTSSAPDSQPASQPVSQLASEPTGQQRPSPPARIKQAVIGIGINWQNPVPDTGITLTEVMARLPGGSAQNKIDCLEMLAALILKGILQGYLFQQQMGSQVFMKAYSNLLTQVGEVVSLNSDLLSLAVTDEHLVGQFSNRSGEIVGVSEEGYLKVAVSNSGIEASRHSSAIRKRAGPSSTSLTTASCLPGCVTTDILLLKPSEICIS